MNYQFSAISLPSGKSVRRQKLEAEFDKLLSDMQ